MGGVKRSLPDDWEPMSIFDQPRKYKYFCVSGYYNKKVIDKWLPRWYGVPFEECLFHSDMKKERDIGGIDPSDAEKEAKSMGAILLMDEPKGTDYKQKLKELKTKHLLNGGY